MASGAPESTVELKQTIRAPFVLIIAAAMALQLCCSSASGDHSQWEDRLFKEGPAAWEAWEQFSKHLEGVVRVTDLGKATVANPKYPAKPPEIIEWLFKFNGDWALQEARRIETSEHGPPDSPLPTTRGAVAITSKYGFSIKRQTDDTPWVIRNVATRNYENLREFFDEGALVYVHAPWELLGKPLGTLIHEPEFKLRACEGVTRDGRELCKVSFDYPLPPEKAKLFPIRGGWVVLDPEQHWAIQEYELQSTQKWVTAVLGSNVYGEVSKGFPLLQEKRRRITEAKGYLEEVAVFTKLAYRDSIPEAEFGLAQYGLPEPFGPLASGKSARAPILILAGLLVIVVAGLLYYRVRSARAS